MEGKQRKINKAVLLRYIVFQQSVCVLSPVCFMLSHFWKNLIFLTRYWSSPTAAWTTGDCPTVTLRGIHQRHGGSNCPRLQLSPDCRVLFRQVVLTTDNGGVYAPSGLFEETKVVWQREARVDTDFLTEVSLILSPFYSISLLMKSGIH